MCITQHLAVLHRGDKMAWWGRKSKVKTGSSLAFGGMALEKSPLVSLSIVFCKIKNRRRRNTRAHTAKGSTSHTAMQPQLLCAYSCLETPLQQPQSTKKKAPVNVLSNDLHRSGKIWKAELFNQNILWRAGREGGGIGLPLRTPRK